MREKLEFKKTRGKKYKVSDEEGLCGHVEYFENVWCFEGEPGILFELEDLKAISEFISDLD